ncbi:hypothetical protein ACLMLE_28440, partial [Lysobacter capsici]
RGRRPAAARLARRRRGRSSGDGKLSARETGNASAAMLPLFDALAARHDRLALPAGAGRILQVELAHD